MKTQATVFILASDPNFPKKYFIVDHCIAMPCIYASKLLLNISE